MMHTKAYHYTFCRLKERQRDEERDKHRSTCPDEENDGLIYHPTLLEDSVSESLPFCSVSFCALTTVKFHDCVYTSTVGVDQVELLETYVFFLVYIVTINITIFYDIP